MGLLMPRAIFDITGRDNISFLQGLITNDIAKCEAGLLYTALLTPQGKYLADFFLLRRGDTILLDADAAQADALVARLNMYRLRADVAITPSPLSVSRGLGPVPADALPDPRHAELGWRRYSDTPVPDDNTDWTALNVAHSIPTSGIELTSDTYILEVGFERLNGVDFRKGCYVGQEITARMKHKTELRKGLVQVEITGRAPIGTEIIAEGKPVGTLYSQSGGHALAYMRFDRANGEMKAQDATLHWTPN